MAASDAIRVAMATNPSYLPWCATGLLSCLRATTDQRLHFHVLHEGGIEPGSQDRLARLVREHGGVVEFNLIDAGLLGTLPTKGPSLGERISWARVLLPEMLPALDRVIYLDADVLALRSLSPLWREDLGGAVLGAVRNVVEPAMHSHVASLGIANPRCYFNAGVLLVDLAAMRADRSWERISEYVRGVGRQLEWFDQDALNVIYGERWKPIHPRWNAQNSFWAWSEWAAGVFGSEELSEAIRDPAIVHFEGPSICKPWHYLCPHPYREHYIAMLGGTPWFDEPLVDRTIVTRLIRRLPQEQRIPAYLKLEAYRARFWQAEARARRVISRSLVIAGRSP